MDNAEKAVLRLSEFLTDIENAVISNPVKKNQQISKIKINKIILKNKPVYQFQRFVENKVIHQNVEWKNVISELLDAMQNDGFKQCSIQGNYTLTILMNKDKQFKITGVKENINYNPAIEKQHNKQKNYILKDNAVPWMVALGLMDKDGVVVSHKQKKYRQINRFLEMLKDIENYLPDNCTIVDMGCGKSYLTFAMYHYFNVLKNKNVTIMGFDLKKDVVEHCNQLADKFGFDKLKFYNKDIAEIENIDNKIGMIITLHACNTATDIALYHGIRWGCRVIMSVPCCQHELFPQIKNKDLSVIMDYGILKERFAALMTDGIRGKILEIMGYKTTIMEFIDMEHTPKNIMIRAIKTNKDGIDTEKKAVLDKLLADYSTSQYLYELCFNNNEE